MLMLRGGVSVRFRLQYLLFAALVGLPLSARAAGPTTAIRAGDFLNSIGVNSAINQRGETLQNTITFAKYLGVRWFRAGIEGNVPMADFITLYKETGARFSWCPGSGGSDLAKLTATARQLAASDALLAFEGPTELNNWPLTYNGEKGGRDSSWLAVAKFQSDLYRAVKSDPVLKKYPVWGREIQCRFPRP